MAPADVRELYALRPDRMKVVPGADGWPQGYEYTVSESTRSRPTVRRCGTRVSKAPFLTLNERRAAVGYGPFAGGDVIP